MSTDEIGQPREDDSTAPRVGTAIPWVGRLSLWASLVGWTVVVLGAAVACWAEISVIGWVINAGLLVILLIVQLGFDRPARHLVRSPFGWFLPACALGGLASVAHFDRLHWSHVRSEKLSYAIVTAIVLTFVLRGLREPGEATVTGRLLFPLPTGRWVVSAGGVSAMNHHLAAAAQTGALDLVAVRRSGARAAGVTPKSLLAYEAFGREVVSPCDGTVVTAVDGQPDQAPWRARSSSPSGNHVRIDNGSEIIHLAHLRNGSVRVSTGDRIVAGQPVGEIGNSGHTAEPHLHVHAERDGVGLRLRFADIPRKRLRPGVAVQVAPAEPLA